MQALANLVACLLSPFRWRKEMLAKRPPAEVERRNQFIIRVAREEVEEAMQRAKTRVEEFDRLARTPRVP